jgi:hypothetical protein
MPDMPLDEIDDAVRKMLAVELRTEVCLTLLFRECDGDSRFNAQESLRYEFTQRICADLATANLITVVVDQEKTTAIEVLEGTDRGWLMYVHGGFEGINALFEKASQLNLACRGWMMAPDQSTRDIYAEFTPDGITLLVRDDIGDEPENE